MEIIKLFPGEGGGKISKQSDREAVEIFLSGRIKEKDRLTECQL